VACIIAYLVTSTRFLSSHKTGVNIDATAIWQQVLLGYSLMSATLPMLKRFVLDFTTGGMGFSTDVNANADSNQHSQHTDTAVELSVLSRHPSVKAPPTATASDPMPVLGRERSTSHFSEGLTHDDRSLTSQGSRQVMIQ